MKRKMSALTIIGKRWFNKKKGSTYHSVEIIADGKQIHRIDYAYGYGLQYEDNAKNWLYASKYLPGIELREGTPGESLFRYCERAGIVYTQSVTDVQRKKDL